MKKKILLLLFFIVSITTIFSLPSRSKRQRSVASFKKKDRTFKIKKLFFHSELYKIKKYYYGSIPMLYKWEFDYDLWQIINRQQEIEETKTDEGVIEDIKISKDTSIKISGVQDAGIDIEYYDYLNNENITDERYIDNMSYSINQKRYLNVVTNIKDRLFIDIDYDDTSDWETKKNILLEYKGKEDEIIQNIKVGDINLSLPDTRLVSFNKKLFGIKGNIKLGPLDYYAFYSKQKGKSSSSSFSGQADQVEFNINNDNYSNDYFNLNRVFEKQEIPSDLSSINVYYDDRVSTNNDDAKKITVTINGSTQQYFFDKLEIDNDFTIINDEGNIIIKMLKNYSNGVIAVEFQNFPLIDEMDKRQIIYSKNDTIEYENEIIVDKGESKYLTKNRYFLNYENINRNEATIKLKDESENVFSSYKDQNGNNYSYSFIFGIDEDNDGEVDPRFIDYQNGVLTFKHKVDGEVVENNRPFSLKEKYVKNGDLNISSLPDNLEEIYEQIGENDTVEMINDLDNNKIYEDTVYESKYKIYLSYFYFPKVFDLRSDILPNSEVVMVNGKILEKNKDYSIDYSSGVIRFKDESLITKNADIEINYEYQPAFLSKNKTLFGNRAEYQINENLKVGATYIKNWMPKEDLDRVPTFVDELESKNVYSTNLNYKYDKNDLKVELKGELAKSSTNPNTYGKVVFEDMQDSKLSMDVSMETRLWNIASYKYLSSDDRHIKTESGNNNVDKLLENEIIDSYRIDSSFKEQKIMTMNIENLPNDPTKYFSYVNVLSKSGRNLSSYKKLVFWYKIEDTSGELILDLGVIDEDADQDGSSNETEDKNQNGILEEGEDTGWSFDYRGDIYKVGANNGVIDEEDLDGDGILNRNEDIASYSINLEQNGEWNRVTIDLNEMTNQDALEFVKYLRLTGTNFNGGNIRFAKFEFIGTNWNIYSDPLIEDSDNQFSVEVIDDTIEPTTGIDYKPLRSYEDQEDISLWMNFDMKEYNTEGENEAYCKKSLGTKRDFSKYNKLTLSYYIENISKESASSNPQLFFRIGSSNENYYEIKKDIEDKSDGWQYLTIENLKNIDDNPSVVKVGDNLNISNISMVQFGIRADQSVGQYSGDIFINDILLQDPLIQEGTAKYIEANVNLNNYWYMYAYYKQKDPNYNQIGIDSTGNYTSNKYISSQVNWHRLLRMKNKEVVTGLSYYDNITKQKYGTNGAMRQNRNKNINLNYQMDFKNLPSFNYGYTKSDNTYRAVQKPYTNQNISHDIELDYENDFLKGAFFNPIPNDISFEVSENLQRKKYINKKEYYMSTKAQDWDLDLSMDLINKMDTEFSYNLREEWDLLNNDYIYSKKDYSLSNHYYNRINNIYSMYIKYDNELDILFDKNKYEGDSTRKYYDYNMSRLFSTTWRAYLGKYLKGIGFLNNLDFITDYSNKTNISYEQTKRNINEGQLAIGLVKGFNLSDLPEEQIFENSYGIKLESGYFDFLEVDINYNRSIEKRDSEVYNNNVRKTTTWPDLSFNINNFRKIPLLNNLSSFTQYNSLRYIYSVDKKDYDKLDKMIVDKTSRIDWETNWENNIRSELEWNYSINEKILSGDNVERKYNYTVVFDLDYFKSKNKLFRNNRRSNIDNYSDSSSNMDKYDYSLGYKFEYDEKWFYNIPDSPKELKISNYFEVEYTISNNINIKGDLGFIMFRSDRSVQNYNKYEMSLKFEIYF